MWMSLRNNVVQLAAGKPVSFRDARGIRLQCVSGRVWVTVEGQAGDYLLMRGREMVIAAPGLVVVEGMPDGAIKLHTPAPWPIRSANGLMRALHARWTRHRRGHAPATRNPARTC